MLSTLFIVAICFPKTTCTALFPACSQHKMQRSCPRLLTFCASWGTATRIERAGSRPTSPTHTWRHGRYKRKPRCVDQPPQLPLCISHHYHVSFPAPARRHFPRGPDSAQNSNVPFRDFGITDSKLSKSEFQTFCLADQVFEIVFGRARRAQWDLA